MTGWRRKLLGIAPVVTLLSVACGHGSTAPIASYGGLMERLRSATSYHMASTVTAPGEIDGLSGTYETDFEAPNRYRTTHRSPDGQLSRSITIGGDIFVSLDNEWRKIDPTVTQGFRDPINVLEVLDDPCRLVPEDRGFRLARL